MHFLEKIFREIEISLFSVVFQSPYLIWCSLNRKSRSMSDELGKHVKEQIIEGVATTGGGAGGAASGAAIGFVVAGPIGVIPGMIAGLLFGGWAGKGVGKDFNQSRAK